MTNKVFVIIILPLLYYLGSAQYVFFTDGTARRRIFRRPNMQVHTDGNYAAAFLSIFNP